MSAARDSLSQHINQHLDNLEAQSIYIFREAYRHFEDLAMLWSIGKDSTAMMWLARKAFLGRVPFPVCHVDTTYKPPELIQFRDHYAKEWGLNLIVNINHEADKKGITPDKGRFECCTARKTVALQQIIDDNGFKGIIAGIRRDEEGSRAKERFFSPRDKNFEWNVKDQPPELWDQFNVSFNEDTHVRIHPLLHWTELDIWMYTKRENIPVCSLYFAKDGKRFRSLGCMPCNFPTPSDASTIDEIIEELKTTKVPERAGRAQDHETAYMMQKLRTLGYM
ncbi:MAG: sulfate adenylyltransferase subunit 2 [Deltaproteobacteria bacterium]|nr:sulfate adenylyltransferase subunit 2 [Deltaproteobacteria bacterium]